MFIPQKIYEVILNSFIELLWSSTWRVRGILRKSQLESQVRCTKSSFDSKYAARSLLCALGTSQSSTLSSFGQTTSFLEKCIGVEQRTETALSRLFVLIQRRASHSLSRRRRRELKATLWCSGMAKAKRGEPGGSGCWCFMWRVLISLLSLNCNNVRQLSLRP